jgi:hypothetical protein
MEITREEAILRVEARGREDALRFHEQFTGQVLACRVLHEAIERLGDWHSHMFGDGRPDGKADWLIKTIGRLRA